MSIKAAIVKIIAPGDPKSIVRISLDPNPWVFEQYRDEYREVELH